MISVFLNKDPSHILKVIRNVFFQENSVFFTPELDKNKKGRFTFFHVNDWNNNRKSFFVEKSGDFR